MALLMSWLVFDMDYCDSVGIFFECFCCTAVFWVLMHLGDVT